MATCDRRRPPATSQRLAQLLIEACEHDEMQDTIAELLRARGWQCSRGGEQGADQAHERSV